MLMVLHSRRFTRICDSVAREKAPTAFLFFKGEDKSALGFELAIARWVLDGLKASPPGNPSQAFWLLSVKEKLSRRLLLLRSSV